MTPPKKIFVDLKRCDLTFIPYLGANTEYISVDHLKEWISARQTKLIDGTVIVSPRICTDLLKFIEDES